MKHTILASLLIIFSSSAFADYYTVVWPSDQSHLNLKSSADVSKACVKEHQGEFFLVGSADFCESPKICKTLSFSKNLTALGLTNICDTKYDKNGDCPEVNTPVVLSQDSKGFFFSSVFGNKTIDLKTCK